MAERLGVVGLAVVYDDEDPVADEFAEFAERQDFESCLELVDHEHLRVRELVVNNDLEGIRVIPRLKDRFKTRDVLRPRLSDPPRVFKALRRYALALFAAAGAYLIVASGVQAHKCTRDTGQALEACFGALTVQDLTFGAVSGIEDRTQPVE